MSCYLFTILGMLQREQMSPQTDHISNSLNLEIPDFQKPVFGAGNEILPGRAWLWVVGHPVGYF